MKLSQRERFATSYVCDPAMDKLSVHEDPGTSRWGKPPPFASGGGLVLTAGDYLAFCRMMLGKDRYGRTRILSPASIELMTMDHLTDARKEGCKCSSATAMVGSRRSIEIRNVYSHNTEIGKIARSWWKPAEFKVKLEISLKIANCLASLLHV